MYELVRFFQFVETKSDCWLWTGAIDGKKYGFFYDDGFHWKSHRWMYKKYWGENPGRLQVCHTCDTPNCVNPEHLFLGSNYENSIDMLKKGRFYNQKKTHCRNGHPYSGNNLRIIRTKTGLGIERRCIICCIESSRRHRRGKKCQK